MKRKRKRTSSSSSKQTVASYLPDECWESIFRFIINDEDDYNYRRCLNSLSLVSKQFLSITNGLLFSFTVLQSTDLRVLFKRFINLNTLKLTSDNLYTDLDTNPDTLLIKISCFPLKLTSLDLSYKINIPAIGLRVFSQKITTLTSLTCSQISLLNTSSLFLIGECFPLLEELDLSYPVVCKNYSSYVDGIKALSLALIKLRKVNLSGFPINDQSLFHLFNNCKYLEEVIIFKCGEITNEGLASALRERPTLTSLSFSFINLQHRREVFSTSHFIKSLVSLNGLTCLVLVSLNITDELLYSIAREVLPLTRLGLQSCARYSYNGILCLLSKCQRIKYLDLEGAYFLEDEHAVQLSLLLGDLVTINLSRCQNLTKSALFTLAKNCPSLSEIKMQWIGSKRVQNSDPFLEFGVHHQLKSLYLGYNSWLNDEIITIFASIFPNLQLLDLINCKDISDEGICQVLKRCCEIRHLNLAGCSRVKLLQMNFVVPKLQVLKLSDTKVGDETLYAISKGCCGLLELLLERCNGVTEKGVKHVLEKCTTLRKLVVKGTHLRDKISYLFSLHGCRIL